MVIIKKIVRDWDYKLLERSQVYANPDLRNFLETAKDLKENQLKKLPPEMQNFYRNLLNRFLMEARDEWRKKKENYCDYRGDNKKDWIHCSLCNEPNKYIFYIVNQYNGNELNVGCECVKNFDKVQGELQKYRTGKKLAYLVKIEDKFPGIDSQVENWKHDLDNFPFVTKPLEDSYLKLGERLNKIYNGYLSGKYNFDQTVIEIGKILSEKAQLLSNIDDFITKNKNDIPTRNIMTWLKSRGERDLIERLKKEEKITWQTAFKIEEPDFMKSLIPKLNKVLQNIDVTILKLDPLQSGYVLDVNGTKSLLFIKYRDIMRDFGWSIFPGELVYMEVTAENIISRSSLYDDNSIDVFLSRLSTKLNNPLFRIYQYDVEVNQIHFLENNKDIVSVDLKPFVEKFKSLIFKTDKQSYTDVIDFVKHLPNKRISIEDFKELKNNRKIN